MTRIIAILIFPILTLLFTAAVLSAQTATLTGRVLDESGAFVPAARIEIRDAGTGATTESTASAEGTYSLTSLTPGRYAVTASAASLLTPQPVEINIHPGAQTLNLQLKIAATAQHLTVDESAGPTISADAGSNASATVIKGDDLDSLSDDPEDLQADLEALAGPSAGPGGSQILIDGFTTADLPPKSSIREVRVNQNPFSPDYDRLGLGRVEIFTKPGTDKYHGVIPYNLGTAHWNSRNPYAGQKAPFLLQELETSFSGPVTKRSSFTLDLEKQNVDNGSITSGVMLDPVTFLAVPFSTVVTTPQRRLLAVPHIDYQLNENNFFSIRYNYTQTHIGQAGIGGFDLISRGYDTRNRFDTIQLLETSIHGGVVNETRALYYRWHNQTAPYNPAAEIQVLGAFNGGGAADTGDHQTEARYELQNNTYIVRGNHSWRFGGRLRGQNIDSYLTDNFGGTFTYSGIAQYRATVLGLPGGGPSLFTVNAGAPETTVSQAEPALFAGDDWRLRPNVTLSLGLRYEAQTNIGDHLDIAPRLGLAWSPGSGTGRGSGWVLRGGFGIFYDRFSLVNTLNAARNNGIVQQQYVVENPAFTTVTQLAPLLASLAANSQQSRQEVYAGLRAPYVMQTALTVERQLSKAATLATTWTSAHGLHQLRSEFLLTPGRGPTFLMSSSGLYNQNQLIFNLNAKVNKAVSLFSSYSLNKAMSNTDGVASYPGNPYDYSGEYGPASTDIRNRFQFGGSIGVPWNIRLSPLFTYQSGAPFNLTTGTDPYGTTLHFARPGLNGSLATPYGMLDPSPAPGEPTIGRNAGRGPAQIMVNLRINKFWTLRGHSTFSVGLSVRNLLNHTNAGPIIGNITSPLFGLANQIAGNSNGQGFFENANNRRFELQLRVTF
jgi:hypothetical protein